MKRLRPKSPRSIVPGALALLALLAAGVPLRADDLRDADRAFLAEDYAAALAAYERVLEERPDDLHALLRSAKLLSWENRLDESISRYERALAVAPESRDALLGLSTVQSWDERFTEARGGFERLLARDPGDAEAMLGVARCLAWSGRLREARPWYERAAEAAPQDPGPRVGLAYLDLWAGDVGGAARRTAALQREHPGHREVERLASDLSKSAGAWWQIDASRLDDTDDNRLERLLVRGGLGLGAGVRLDLGYGRYEMSDPGGDASIDNLEATVAWYPVHGQRIAALVGVDRRTRTDDSTDDDLLGGLRYSWGLDRRWQLHAAAMRHSIRYSPTITDNGIVFDQLEASVRGAVGARLNVFATVGTADFSDDNGRMHALAGFSYRVPLRRPTLRVGYSGRYMDYDLDLASGYFDPQSFTAHLAQLRLQDRFGKRGWSWSVSVDGGVQSFTAGGNDVNNDGVWILAGTLTAPLTRRLELDLYADDSDYAATSAAGFESHTVGLRLRWRAGWKGAR